MSRTFRAAELWIIAGAMAAVSVGVWLTGEVLDIGLLRFAGFMFGASTFVPLPADAYLLSVAADHNAVVLGVVGGAVNALAVMGEREWLLRLTAHRSFDRLKDFVGTNRWVDAMASGRYLFVGLLVAGFSFLPFEPFRLLAVLRNYSPVRYALATFLGRGFRYYWLARAGGALAVYGVVRWVVWASLALFAFGLVRSYLRFRSTAR